LWISRKICKKVTQPIFPNEIKAIFVPALEKTDVIRRREPKFCELAGTIPACLVRWQFVPHDEESWAHNSSFSLKLHCSGAL